MFTVGLLPGFRDSCTSVHFFLGQPPSVTVLVTSLHRCLLTWHSLSYPSRLIGIPGRLCQTVGSSYYIHLISMSLYPLLAWKKWWLYSNCCFQALFAMKPNTSLIYPQRVVERRIWHGFWFPFMRSFITKASMPHYIIWCWALVQLAGLIYMPSRWICIRVIEYLVHNIFTPIFERFNGKLIQKKRNLIHSYPLLWWRRSCEWHVFLILRAVATWW